jgi:hypothetical protein
MNRPFIHCGVYCDGLAVELEDQTGPSSITQVLLHMRRPVKVKINKVAFDQFATQTRSR